MSKIMQDYGMLDENEKPTPKAIDIYISHCEEIAKNGKTNLPFRCYEGRPDPNAKNINLRDREKYKDFYANWVYGAYADALKSINLESNIALPIFDPMALPSKLPDIGLKEPIPPMGLDEILAMMALPISPDQKIQMSLIRCGINPADLIDPTKLAELLKKAGEIIVPLPPIPQIPEIIPPLEFPNLSYDVPKYNLLDSKLRIYTSIPTAFLEVFKEFANPVKIIDIAAKGPAGFLDVFSLACKSLNKALPPQPDNNSYSSEVYQAAIAASLSKAMGVTVIGSIIGSSKNGVVGGLGKLKPDAPKDPIPEIDLSPPEEKIEQPTSTSEQGREWLRTLEQFAAYPYVDPPGQDVTYSVGYGHQIQPWEKNIMPIGKKITKEKAIELFNKDIKIMENAINKYIRPSEPLNQAQYDVLASYYFGVGYGKASPGNKVSDLVNAGKYQEFLNYLEKSLYVTTGQILKALRARRLNEINLWKTGDYTIYSENYYDGKAPK